MRYSIAAILFLLAPVHALPSELYPRDKGGLCSIVGGLCHGIDSECCNGETGFAICTDGISRFQKCANGCLEVAEGSTSFAQCA